MKFSGARLKVYFAADSVSAVWQRGIVRRNVRCASAPVPREDSGNEPWAPALRALDDLLASEDWPGSAIDIAMSSEFVHLALVPAIRQNLSSLELQGLANSVFARVLGEAAAGWSVRYCAGRSTILAAATQTPLLAALLDLARARQCTLRSVSPLWSCAVNRQRKHLVRRTAWLVVAEPRAVAFGLMEQGTWRSVRAKQLDPERGLCVAKLIEREARYMDTDTRELIFVGDAPAGGEYPPEWKLEALPIADKALGAIPERCRPAVLAGS